MDRGCGRDSHYYGEEFCIETVVDPVGNDLLGERLRELRRVCGEVIYDVVAKGEIGD